MQMADEIQCGIIHQFTARFVIRHPETYVVFVRKRRLGHGTFVVLPQLDDDGIRVKVEGIRFVHTQTDPVIDGGNTMCAVIVPAIVETPSADSHGVVAGMQLL